MKKIIYILLVIVAVIAGYYLYVYWALGDDSGTRGALEGEVSAINLEGVMVDAPALVTISTEDGEKVIAVPSMGRNLCVAKELADVYALKVGDVVSVKGEVDEEGRIVPCMDESHFMRVK